MANLGSKVACLATLTLVSVVACLAMLATVVQADTTVPVYTKGQAQRYRASIAVVDSAAIDGANVVALPVIDCGLNQVVLVDLKMSVASATCKVHFVRSVDANWARPVSKTSAVATADSYFTIQSKFVADGLYFDTGSFRYFKVLVEAPSSGNVDIDVTVCGSKVQ